MKDNLEEERQWLDAIGKLEDERGSIVVGGAQGGVVAKYRRAQAGVGARPAAARSRGRLRHSFQAVEQIEDRAA